MLDDDDILVSPSLSLMVQQVQQDNDRERERAEMQEHAKNAADDARLALAALAEPSVKVIAWRLFGAPAEGGQGALKAGEFPVDDNGKPVTKEREEVAWEILSRIGVPRLRATAIAASFAAAPNTPAPGSPGWVPPELEGDEALELGEATVDAKIEAYMQGAVDGVEAARKKL